MATVPAPDRTSVRNTSKEPAAVGSATLTTSAKPSRRKQRVATVEPKNTVPRNGILQTAVIGRAIDMGLMGTEVHQVGARIPKKLLAQAKKRTGIASTTDLVEFALANVAVEDNFANAFAAARGKIDPDLDIGF